MLILKVCLVLIALTLKAHERHHRRHLGCQVKFGAVRLYLKQAAAEVRLKAVEERRTS